MDSDMDLLLVNPSGRYQIYQNLGAKLTAIEPPVWAGLMASFSRQKGLRVGILDAEAEGLSSRETAKRVKEMKPILAAVVVYGHQPSASTQNMPAAGATCTAIKEQAPGSKVLLVGGHVAALPERTLREEDADFVCGGEGLLTLTGLVQALKSGRAEDLAKVPDLWYFDGEALRRTPPAPLVRELDRDIPSMPWELLPMERYRAHNWHCFGDLKRQPYAALYTTLGCPYHCGFCCIQAPFKSGEKAAGLSEEANSYRFWSPQAVVRQIDVLVRRYGVRNIKIADEMFVLNPRHVEGLCDLLTQRGYGLNIWAYARVDTVKDGMIPKLKKAGFNWLAFGIEAGSERVRKSVDKGFSQEDIFHILRKVRDAGINVIGNYIFGLPEDDLGSMQATLDLALELNCEFANFYSTMAYPGSALYRQALKEGWLLPKKWSGYSQHSVDTLPLPTKRLKASQVLKFRDKAFLAYFTNRGYLDMVEKKFGSDTRAHIEQMTKVKLARENV